MLNTYEARIDEQGNLQIPEGIVLPEGCKVLITVLQEQPEVRANEEALLSEQVLKEDWEKKEEDDAWQSLNRE